MKSMVCDRKNTAMKSLNLKKTVPLVLLALALIFSASKSVRAFCGFYVSGADASLYNNATLVVLMREGTKTVLSMQNNYQGPPEDFALVIPVPVVLREGDVKTLPHDIFSKVDKLTAPRLAEYWEEDPCNPRPPYQMMRMASGAPTVTVTEGAVNDADHGVRIEAQFAVAEYQIVILSAQNSTGLDSWLRASNYKIPEGAEPVLRPYVQNGTKFFVAKVDSSKVRFENGKAVLSPLRFHYDSQDFSLPVRLGILNSNGTQDLIVHILGRGQRYEVANYNNAFIPTNLIVDEAKRANFGSYYNKLFDDARRDAPKSISGRGTVITEYSWDASSCDPCPTPPLEDADLATLGADVLDAARLPPRGDRRSAVIMPPMASSGWVLTRLHYRYTSSELPDDLVFRPAPAVMGGRGVPSGPNRELERSTTQDAYTNNFQGRYLILNEWKGPLSCPSPQRGIWGGPPAGEDRPMVSATGLSLMRSGMPLPSVSTSSTSGSAATDSASVAETPTGSHVVARAPKKGGCASCMIGRQDTAGWVAGVLALFGAGFLLARKVRNQK